VTFAASRALTPALLAMLRRAFRLEWRGIHGAPHWARVRLNGLLLARETGAREDVVELFAFLHDSQRFHEGGDREHGARAADSVRAINASLLRLDPAGLDQLIYACRHHSDGLTEADATVQTCWDADRLDLARVGTRPAPRYLCTAAARNPGVIAAAVRRSLAERAARA
jgi:uncharacterized protein